MKHHRLLLAGLLLFSTTVLAIDKTSSEQSNQAVQHSQQTMPFAVDQTLQTFSKTVHGGIQHIAAKSADNTRQIKLIQTYLMDLANQFKKGDFSESERIHGAGMPGLARLKTAKTDDIKFDYKGLGNGGQIHYSTEYPELVQALHEWFDAQIQDHGNDVIPEHIQHHSTPAE